MSSNIMRTLQSGSTIWGMVSAANPNASDARIAKMTNAVLKDNDMTATEARSLRAGTKIDLSEALPDPPKPAAKAAAPAKPATPATPATPVAQPLQPMVIYLPSNIMPTAMTPGVSNATPATPQAMATDPFTQLQQNINQQNVALQSLLQQVNQATTSQSGNGMFGLNNATGTTNPLQGLGTGKTPTNTSTSNINPFNPLSILSSSGVNATSLATIDPFAAKNLVTGLLQGLKF